MIDSMPFKMTQTCAGCKVLPKNITWTVRGTLCDDCLANMCDACGANATITVQTDKQMIRLCSECNSIMEYKLCPIRNTWSVAIRPVKELI
jgi:ribosomal protein L24E